MWFDAQAALKKLELAASTPAIPANPAVSAHPNQPQLARIAEKALPERQNRATPDLDAFEARAAICEFDGGLTRADAECLAAQCQGYENVVAFRAAQMKSTKGIPK